MIVAWLTIFWEDWYKLADKAQIRLQQGERDAMIQSGSEKYNSDEDGIDQITCMFSPSPYELLQAQIKL